MSTLLKLPRTTVVLLASIAVVLSVGCAMMGSSQTTSVSLSGGQEVPRVSTSASGTGQITVDSGWNVSGSISTSGMTPTAAHIHDAAAGKNGPVAIPLKKTSDNTFVVPDGARLNDAQYASYRSGGLYVNVHSAANPGGEIRAQIVPKM